MISQTSVTEEQRGRRRRHQPPSVIGGSWKTRLSLVGQHRPVPLRRSSRANHPLCHGSFVRWPVVMAWSGQTSPARRCG